MSLRTIVITRKYLFLSDKYLERESGVDHLIVAMVVWDKFEGSLMVQLDI